jgi:phosphonate transport system permease protein
LEWNVRGAAVIGFVGAGGIGTDLLVAIRKFYYADVSAMLLMIVACVMLLDMISERLRHRLLSFETDAASASSASRGTRVAVTLAACAIATYFAGLFILDVTPIRLFAGIGRLTDIATLMLPPTPGSVEHFRTYIAALGETLAIAFLGTALASVFAFPLGFVAARNVVANRILHFLVRRTLDAVRSVDTLVWALIWINVVGLGPFAGALAIASTDMAALAKLVSEAIETADKGPMDGMRAAGGGRLAVMRFGILPQVLPIFASQALYFFESNTRSATIIGIVGAGGIGLYLSEMIRVLEWRETAFLILLVLVAVAVIDAVSRRLRAAIIGAQPG